MYLKLKIYHFLRSCEQRIKTVADVLNIIFRPERTKYGQDS
jgi:hypothetical protein